MDAFLREYMGNNPHLGAQEALLLVYESAGGAGNEQEEYALTQEIEKQGSGLSPEDLLAPYVQQIGGGYCRMNLSVLQIIPASLLGRMVANSRGGYAQALFAQGVHCLSSMCAQGRLTFSNQRLHKLVVDNAFLPKQAPSYRVVREIYGQYLAVFLQVSRLLNQGAEVTVAIEGPSAAGKATLAALLTGVFGGNCFCTADYVHGGVFDSVGFQREILMQLNTGKPFTYTPQGALHPQQVAPSRLNIVQGLYSLHPSLQKYYELKLFLDVSPLTQTKRLLAQRGEEGLQQFSKEIAPRESAYLQNVQADLHCDCVFHT